MRALRRKIYVSTPWHVSLPQDLKVGLTKQVYLVVKGLHLPKKYIY